MTPWPAEGHAPLFMEFSRQEYWSGWPFPTPGYFPDPSLFLQNLSPEQGVSQHHSPRLRLRAHRGVGRALVGKRESMSYSERVMWGSRRQAGRKRAIPGDCLDETWLLPFGTKLKGRKIRKVAVTDHALNPGAHCCRG